MESEHQAAPPLPPAPLPEAQHTTWTHMWWFTHSTHSPLRVNVVVTHCCCGQTQIIHILFAQHNIHLYVHVPMRPNFTFPTSLRSSVQFRHFLLRPRRVHWGRKKEKRKPNPWLFRLHYQAGCSLGSWTLSRWALWFLDSFGLFTPDRWCSSPKLCRLLQAASPCLSRQLLRYKENNLSLKWSGENVANHKGFERGWWEECCPHPVCFVCVWRMFQSRRRSRFMQTTANQTSFCEVIQVLAGVTDTMLFVRPSVELLTISFTLKHYFNFHTVTKNNDNYKK